MRTLRQLLPLALLTSGCSTGALKNTEKLAKQGHVSLYENGAFRVPNSTIDLIPPGPDAWNLAMTLMGRSARQSFVASVRNAAQSVWIVYDGKAYSYRAAKGIREGAMAGAGAIQKAARPGTTLLIEKSSALAKTIVGKSFEFGPIAEEAVSESTANLSAAAKAAGRAASERGQLVSERSLQAAKEISTRGKLAAGERLAGARNAFVMGFVAVPAKMRARGKEAARNVVEADFLGNVAESSRSREKWSQTTVDLMADTAHNYSKNVGESFSNAGRELSEARDTGVSFAMLRSIRWALQGALADAIVVPAAKMTGAALGYIGVNMAAFPCIVVVKEGAATAELAVETVWVGAESLYDLTAPTPVAAVAAVYGLGQGLAAQAGAFAVAAGGWTAGQAEAKLGRAAAVTVDYGSRGAAKGLRYVGVPLAQAGVTLGAGVIGVAAGGTGVGAGSALRVAGETAAYGTEGLGNVLAGTALVGGTAASVGVAGAYDVYQLSKAVIVPPSYALAGGIVLDYETLSQLGAQSILAAADCSYLVLSLEGPRWVLYAVKGKKDDGSNLPTGAMIDLKKLQQSGEDLYYIPVSDGEMKKVVNSLYDHLPTLPAPKSAPPAASVQTPEDPSSIR